MREKRTELRVGIFALIVLAILSYMTFKVSGKEWFRKDGYTLDVYFTDTAGIEEESKVKVMGVDGGVVEKIVIEGNKARVVLRINPEIRIYSDAVVHIKASGLLGEKNINIMPGFEGVQLVDGDTILEVQKPIAIQDLLYRFDEVALNLQSLTGNINDIIGDVETKHALKETSRNLLSITETLDTVIDENDKMLKDALEGIREVAASIKEMVEENRGKITETAGNFRDASSSIKEEIPKMVSDMRAASGELKDLLQENMTKVSALAENADRVMLSASRISEKIEKGEGTLGKLVTDKSLYESVTKAAGGVDKTLSRMERFRAFLRFQGDYLTRSGDMKGSFNLTLKPRPDKYYILGLVGDPAGDKTSTGTELEITAQIAKRFGDTAVRLGAIESSPGIGVDQFIYNDSIKFSADIWDIGKNEVDADNPHLKLGVDYNITKNLFLSAGADNLLNTRTRGIFVGAGVTFEDEDFKYLLGAVPNVPR